MGIGEGQDGILGMLFGHDRQAVPPVADIDALIFQAPQHGGGVGEIQIIVAGRGPKLLVVMRQHHVELALYQMEQGLVPPSVEAEIIQTLPFRT